MEWSYRVTNPSSQWHSVMALPSSRRLTPTTSSLTLPHQTALHSLSAGCPLHHEAQQQSVEIQLLCTWRTDTSASGRLPGLQPRRNRDNSLGVNDSHWTFGEQFKIFLHLLTGSCVRWRTKAVLCHALWSPISGYILPYDVSAHHQLVRHAPVWWLSGSESRQLPLHIPATHPVNPHHSLAFVKQPFPVGGAADHPPMHMSLSNSTQQRENSGISRTHPHHPSPSLSHQSRWRFCLLPARYPLLPPPPDRPCHHTPHQGDGGVHDSRRPQRIPHATDDTAAPPERVPSHTVPHSRSPPRAETTATTRIVRYRFPRHSQRDLDGRFRPGSVQWWRGNTTRSRSTTSPPYSDQSCE
ncbi:hypothetical protein GBAR_LOCUS9828 [Geodia barretti]|uniref:Uncharacterized protein n=1 Tax=Geodia barretti TaxID=519541 RepID=A0AA35WJD4_GEOBA|nr:hypothetical protein GBAR_LOCUS9828 [Geodia barretti]